MHPPRSFLSLRGVKRSDVMAFQAAQRGEPRHLSPAPTRASRFNVEHHLSDRQKGFEICSHDGIRRFFDLFWGLALSSHAPGRAQVDRAIATTSCPDVKQRTEPNSRGKTGLEPMKT